MNKTVRIFSAIAIAAFSATATKSFAQQSSTDNADAHATVVTPISIVKSTDMDFGNVAVGGSGGTVVLTAGAVASRSTTGNATLPATTGTVGAASFDVSGQAGYVYSIALPSSITITDGSSHNMTISSILSSPSAVSGGTLDGSGHQTIYVGGTMTLSGTQTAGTYNTVSPFDITVVYN